MLLLAASHIFLAPVFTVLLAWLACHGKATIHVLLNMNQHYEAGQCDYINHGAVSIY